MAVPDQLRPLRAWLTGRHSLTRRLVAASSSFAVVPLFEGRAVPRPDEARLLGLRPGVLARVRQVALVCDGQPAVYGHTLLPLAPRHPFDRIFRGLGRRPLGGALFADPRIQRGPLRFRWLDGRHGLGREAARHAMVEDQALLPRSSGRFLARRSLFSGAGKSVLVTEVFLPGLPPPPAG